MPTVVNPRDPQEIIARVRGMEQDKVKVAVTDIDGILRGKYIHKDKFLSAAADGFGFCNVVFGWDCGDACYDNARYTGWHTGYPDAHASIDLSTFRRIPWDHDVAFFLADFLDAAGQPLAVCPRQLLKTVVQRARNAGYAPRFGLELEWFNFRETPDSLQQKQFAALQPLSSGMFGYSILRSSLNGDYCNALLDDLNAFGVPIEGLHTETGPGVFEAAIVSSEVLEAADRAVLFKTAVKEIAYRFGIVPTFMAKINPQLPGCSGHLHQSLCRGDDGSNLFFSEAPSGMSPVFESYLAGQLQCLPDILPLFAPNVNSYKRLVEGHWAPTRVTWGIDNRTAALRVIKGGRKATRLETRVSGSDINPYLGVAAALASGLYGIERGLRLQQEAIKGSAYQADGAARLPTNLAQAAERMGRSEVARELFGEAFVDHYVNTRLWEWRQFEQQVTHWERQRYLEII